MKRNTLFILVLAVSCSASAQQESTDKGDKGQYPAPVNFTAQQDHDNMMQQLGIKAVRPGPSGDEKAPNHANQMRRWRILNLISPTCLR